MFKLIHLVLLGTVAIGLASCAEEPEIMDNSSINAKRAKPIETTETRKNVVSQDATVSKASADGKIQRCFGEKCEKLEIESENSEAGSNEEMAGVSVKCTSGEFKEQSCSIANGKGKQITYCANGEFKPGPLGCLVDTCDSENGYAKVGDRCKLVQCDTSIALLSCEEDLGSGSGHHPRTCDMGKWTTDLNTCHITKCSNSKFRPLNGTCVRRAPTLQFYGTKYENAKTYFSASEVVRLQVTFAEELSTQICVTDNSLSVPRDKDFCLHDSPNWKDLTPDGNKVVFESGRWQIGDIVTPYQYPKGWMINFYLRVKEWPEVIGNKEFSLGGPGTPTSKISLTPSGSSTTSVTMGTAVYYIGNKLPDHTYDEMGAISKVNASMCTEWTSTDPGYCNEESNFVAIDPASYRHDRADNTWTSINPFVPDIEGRLKIYFMNNVSGKISNGASLNITPQQ